MSKDEQAIEAEPNLAIKNFDFGIALCHMKRGRRVARKGWNGKGMWIALTPGSTIDPCFARVGHAVHHLARENPNKPIDLLPRIDMKSADGSMVVGWLASQTDMLADDWMLVE